MPVLADDSAVAQRVLDHIAAGTTDLSEGVWREPVDNYRSSRRFAAERALLRRLPTPFCPSVALPEPGSYVARAAAGTPLVAVRGRDGVVRAFRNACRHRGAQIAAGSGCTRAFTCAYHGWTYGLDGALRHIPHREGFPGLEYDTHGLAPVPTLERGGLVFVNQDGSGSADELGELPEMLGTGQHHFATSESEVPANWKVLLESFLEGYHIRFLHKETFYPFGFDNLNLVEQFGRNSRVTFPFRRISRLEGVPPEQRSVDGLVTFVYHLFANALVTQLSHHTDLLVLEPVALDRTRLVTYSMTSRDRTDEQGRKDAQRDVDFVASGTKEDMAMVRAIQEGITSGANDAFEFGRFEGAISHFHRVLDTALAEDG
jgi:phenylpropionate dioxygenase-like ring-hydroxylating dioxygenase large terminal subunit